jgi:hypothetical protein
MVVAPDLVVLDRGRRNSFSLGMQDGGSRSSAHPFLAAPPRVPHRGRSGSLPAAEERMPESPRDPPWIRANRIWEQQQGHEREDDSVAGTAGTRGHGTGTPCARRRGRPVGCLVGTGGRLREGMRVVRISGDRSVPRAARCRRPSGCDRRHGECSGITGARRRRARLHGGSHRVNGSMGLRLMLPFFVGSGRIENGRARGSGTRMAPET